MQSGRIEHRMSVSLVARLESADMPFSEVVSITNISSHGARVITHRNWRARDHAVLVEPTSDFHTDAEVIYCQRLRDHEYVVGLNFELSAAQLLTPSR
jgi:hypothetical protein